MPDVDDDTYVGEIRMFGGNFAPSGFLFCNGQTLPVDQYLTLFSLIGTTYGGDGETNFMLPDLRGRIPIHSDTTYLLGQNGGAEMVSLVPNNLPAHTHSVKASDTGGSDAPKGLAWGTSSVSNAYAAANPNFAVQMSTLGISTVGGGKPHDNMSPFLCVSFIIAFVGIYPSRPLQEGENQEGV